MITMQTYVQAQSLEEAWQLNQKRSARILGGMLWTRMESRPVSTAIDLCRLGLDTIEETDAAFTLGAMVTLRQIELHPGLAAYTGGAAAAAVRDIVGVQFRNMATIGGSVWGRFGFSDLLTWLLASGAEVELYKGGVVPLEAFAAMPYDRDVLVRVILPKRPGAAFAYQAVRIGRTDLPVLNCAAARLDGTYRVAVGARPGKAVLLQDDAGLLARGVDEESAAAFGRWAAGQVPTGSNARGSAAYRTHLVKVLSRRALLALDRTGGDQG